MQRVIRCLAGPLHKSAKEVVTVEGIVQIIQSLGFPIACVVAMFIMWQSEVKAHDAEMEKMRTTLEDQSKATTEALNRNTIVLEKIMTLIGGDAKSA